MKRIYKLHPSGKGLVDITEEWRRIPESVAPAIWGEIEPYQFMGESHRADAAKGEHEIITSRTRHKEVLKEGGYIEVGNEKLAGVRSREDG